MGAPAADSRAETEPLIPQSGPLLEGKALAEWEEFTKNWPRDGPTAVARPMATAAMPMTTVATTAVARPMATVAMPTAYAMPTTSYAMPASPATSFATSSTFAMPAATVAMPTAAYAQPQYGL